MSICVHGIKARGKALALSFGYYFMAEQLNDKKLRGINRRDIVHNIYRTGGKAAIGGIFYMMDNVNKGVSCEVKNCKYNEGGMNCTLNKIQIGCGNEQCTCCESFAEKRH